MQLPLLLERATAKTDYCIVVLEDSDHLIPLLGPFAARVVALPDARGPVLRIGAIGTSGIEDAVRVAAEGLGEHDLLLLALRSAPDRLPVGALVDTLVECGLWVVDAASIPARGLGCALVVTRDDSAPWRSYLLGDTIPGTERSVLRMLAERAVEGLAERAFGAASRNRERERTLELSQARVAMEGREAELDQLRQAMENRAAEVDQLRRALDSRAADVSRISTQSQALVDLQALELKRVTEQLRREEQLQREARRARKGSLMAQAVRLVRQDPVHGSARVLGSALRRARRLLAR